MKKVIVAAAGLMLVGTMASTAMAEVKFSGDARARFYYLNDYPAAADDETFWNSRVRLNIEADTKGGAYAIARLLNDVGTWSDGDNENTQFDRAYIGVPFGPVTVEAGKQGRDLTPFLLYGLVQDGIDLNYKTDKTTVVAFYDIQSENRNVANDDDKNIWGAFLNQQFDGGWGLTVAGYYLNDEVPVAPATTTYDGFAGTVEVTGAVGAVSLTGALAYEQEELTYTPLNDDAGWGGYLSATMPVGAVSLTGIIGFTADGYVIDQGDGEGNGDDFGPFLMVNGVSQISTNVNFDALGESLFIDLNPTYKVTEDLTLGANFAYISIDKYTATPDRDMWEIGGTATYAVTDGASMTGLIGYLETDDELANNPFGVGVRLDVKF